MKTIFCFTQSQRAYLKNPNSFWHINGQSSHHSSRLVKIAFILIKFQLEIVISGMPSRYALPPTVPARTVPREQPRPAHNGSHLRFLLQILFYLTINLYRTCFLRPVSSGFTEVFNCIGYAFLIFSLRLISNGLK